MERTDDGMRRSFHDAAAARLKRCALERHDELLVGFETEVSVVRREDLEPVSQATRDAIIADLGGSADVELGAFQLELRTAPLDIRSNGLVGVCAALRDVERAARRAAAVRDATILRCGFYPFLMDLAHIERTNILKYQVVPNFHDERRGRYVNTLVGRADPINIGYASVIALANSVQFNLQVADPDRAVALANCLLSASPVLCALAGNARFLAGRDLGVADGRMLAWERSHDTRDVVAYLNDTPTRIGLPGSYYDSVEDYLARVASFPFILDSPEKAFQVGIGLYWNDVRIKFPNDRIVVEYRPLSVQPTAIEDMALFAAVLGIVTSNDGAGPLRPVPLLARDRDVAFTHGLDANLHVWNGHTWVLAPARQIVSEALAIARCGLESLGLLEDAATFLPVLERRLTTGTPSERLAREVDELTRQSFTVPEALRAVLRRRCLINDEE